MPPQYPVQATLTLTITPACHSSPMPTTQSSSYFSLTFNALQLVSHMPARASRGQT